MDFEQQLALAMRTTAERVVPPVEELVHAGGQRGRELRRRRSGIAVALGGGVGVLMATVILLGSGLVRGSSTTSQPSPPSAPSPGPSTCAPVRTDALPSWAWAGFSNPKAGGIPWVLGEDGNILAVLFGQPLSAPEAKDHANKILWVSQHGQNPMEPLVVEVWPSGTVMRPNPVSRIVIPGGPGPSYLNLPAPGCWHLDLSWDNGKQHDTMDLAYVKRAG